MKAIAPPAQEETPPPPADIPPGTREYAMTPTEQPGRVGPQTEVGAAQETAGSPEMAEDEQQGRGPVLDAGGAQEGSERRWWEFWR
jgi:hypothetical protein